MIRLVAVALLGAWVSFAQSQEWLCDGTFRYIPHEKNYYVVTYTKLDPSRDAPRRPWYLQRDRLPRDGRELAQVLVNSITWDSRDRVRRPDWFRNMRIKCEKLEVSRQEMIRIVQDRHRHYRDRYGSQGYETWLTGTWSVRKQNWEGIP